MQQTCRNPWCKSSFEVTDDDLKFFEDASPVFGAKKYLFPSPLLCPDCRMQRRLMFRNERRLYRRTCDLTGKQIVSVYPPDAPYKVYDYKEWISDHWDALSYGRSFDSSRPFLEQFAELEREVPKTALLIRNCENSDYVNNDESDKNCYMTFASGFIEDCYYGRLVLNSRNCVDCNNVFESELCYECCNATASYHCFFSQNISNCRDLLFCDQMVGCGECIGCVGLRQKKHCLFNEQKTKEEFLSMRDELLSSSAAREAASKRLSQLKATVPMRYGAIVNAEDCTGDYITNSQHCTNCYDVVECQDCVNVWDTQMNKNCREMMIGYRDELTYNTMGVALDSFKCYCGVYCWGCQEIAYCQHCFQSKYLFGCVGLQHNQYCILNKQYSKEEYERLVPRIIEQMQKSGTWAEFFPVELSPFAYSETIAQEYFPLSKQEVEKRGWRWRKENDEMPKVSKVIPAQKLPESIAEIPDDILDWAIQCETTGRPFRIVKPELEFYRTMKLPIPHLHPDERHRLRMALRNPRKLWERQCAKCGKSLQTSYAPDRPEIVYCESCYLSEVY